MIKNQKKVLKKIFRLSIFMFIMISIFPIRVFAEEDTDDCKKFKSGATPAYWDGKYGFDLKYTGNYTYEVSFAIPDDAPNSVKKVKNNIKFKITEIAVLNNDTGKAEKDMTEEDEVVLHATTDEEINSYVTSSDKVLTLKNNLTINGSSFAGDNYTLFVVIGYAGGYVDPDQKASCKKNNTLEYILNIDVSSEPGVNVESYTDEGNADDMDITKNAIDCNVSHPDGSWESKWCALVNASNTTSKREFEFKGNKFSGDPVGFKCDYKKYIPQDAKSDTYYANKETMSGTSITKKVAKTSPYTWNCKDGKQEIEASCKIECEEQVVVEYGPPIASQAGLCFEYKVRVTSMANCKVVEKPKKPKSTTITCSGRTPRCQGKSKTFNAAGPNDDFDNCITKCDGGKYTSECNNKCYSEVYGTSVSKQNSKDEISYADKLNNDTVANNRSLALEKVKVDTTPRWGKSGNEVVWMPYGEVIESGKFVERKNCSTAPGNHDCVTDPPFYRDTSHTWGSSGSVYAYYNHWGIPTSITTTTRTYHTKFWNGKVLCNETCWWTGCSNSQSSSKTTDSNGVPSVTCNYGEGAEAEAQKEADKKANDATYEALKAECEAGASCTKSTTSFTVSVGYTNGKYESKIIEFPYSSKNDIPGNDRDVNNKAKTTDKLRSQGKDDKGGTLSPNNAVPSNSIPTILSYDGCYSSDVEKVEYEAEWGFPGTWLKNKTGDITYNKGKGGGVTKLSDGFCMPGDARDVNTKWWSAYYYNLYGKNDDPNYSYNDESARSKFITSCDGNIVANGNKNGSKSDKNEVVTSVSESDIDWNINAVARNFGFFGWNIDVKCFYALYRNYESPPPDDSDKCDAFSYSIRSVDLKYLFPDEKTPKLTNASKTGRTPGFNWSKYATQTSKDPNYQVMPNKYAHYVQSKAYSIYSDEYLDYEVNLTKAVMSKIIDHGRDYTDWKGDVVVGSALHYKSPLFRNVGASASPPLESSPNKYPNEDALKCNNMKNYKSHDCEVDEIKKMKGIE